MKYDKILGEDYNTTFGAILNYKKLAKFLLNLSCFQKGVGFIDLACGTGSLLNEIRISNNSIPLVGVDIDEKQLLIAKGITVNTTLLKGDLFSFTIPNMNDSVNWVAHLGFAFFNRLTFDEIDNFFRNLSKNRIKSLIIEIWDYDYQLKNFNYNTWYKTKLPNGSLMTKSVPFNNNDNIIEMTFEFILNEKKITSNYIMFRHKLSSIENIAKKYNWANFSILRATYRDNIESHKTILVSR